MLEIMKDTQLGLGTWISIGDPCVTEIVSQFGFGWLLFDMEHGCVEPSGIVDNLRACSSSDVTRIVRVGEPDPHLIGHVLDYGADGIMVPHISDAETAARIVRFMRYPPKGERGLSTSVRAFKYGMNVPEDLSEYPKPLLFVQIEDLDGVVNADMIAAVDGVDVLFVGPRDLGLDLSVRKDSIGFDDALARVADAALSNGKYAGILMRNTSDLKKYQKMGFSVIAAGSDMGMLKSGYKGLMDSMDGHLEK